MKSFKGLIIVVLLLVVIIFVLKYLIDNQQPTGKNHHDPFNLGYPEDPNKPEIIKKAEQMLVEERHYVKNRLTFKRLEELYHEFSKDLQEHNMCFLSKEEERKYLITVMKGEILISSAKISSLRKGKITRQADFTAIDFCREIGLPISSTANSIRAIKLTYDGLTWKELKKFILVNELPERFSNQRKKFEQYLE